MFEDLSLPMRALRDMMHEEVERVAPDLHRAWLMSQGFSSAEAALVASTLGGFCVGLLLFSPDPALRVRALETLLTKKGLIDPAALDAIIDTYEHRIGPRNGAQTAPTAMENQPAGGTADRVSSMSTSGPAVDSGPAGYSFAAGDGQAVSGQSPIHALTFLQQGEPPQGELAVESADLTSGQVNILHGIKHSSLMRDIGKGGDMTIDIVAMLFDYILDDKNIPDSMRALIGRLQIPLLKIALLDREFFSRKSHPARQLLNRLAATAVGWDEQQGDKDPLYLMVQSIVQTIVEEFDDDVSLFETLLNDLETFLHKEEEQAVVRAERSAKVMEGQERLEVAKTSTLEEIAPHVNDQQNLGFIRDFLSTHWKNLLVVTCARQGKDSEAWKQAVTTMDELIWSVKPKFTHEHRQQLVAMQSKLLNNLREGMERLGMPSTERDDFIAKLVHAHGRTAVNNKDATETVETPADSNSDKNETVSDASLSRSCWRIT